LHAKDTKGLHWLKICFAVLGVSFSNKASELLYLVEREKLYKIGLLSVHARTMSNYAEFSKGLHSNIQRIGLYVR
jgi:hypothetical protein